MNCFLVDYENVHVDGLRGISALSEQDKVVIFYSEKAETLTFGLHRRLTQSKAQISFQKVPTGSKNALDFQLCTYLGYLICQNAQTSAARDIYDEYDAPTEQAQTSAAYHIVSGDQNYAVISDYWRRKSVSVSLIPEISAFSDSGKEMPAPVKAPSQNPTGDLKSRLQSLLPEKHKKHLPVIAEIIRNHPTKQAAHSELTRMFHQGADTSVPNEIYRAVKPLLLSDTEKLQAELKGLLPKKYENHIPAIMEIIRRCKTKQSVNGELVKAFHEGADNSVPSEIYKSIKPILSDKA